MPVSISDEKPVPSPLGPGPALSIEPYQFQSQMRSQFPRHVMSASARLAFTMFQSQMRSQFPRHYELPWSYEFVE